MESYSSWESRKQKHQSPTYAKLLRKWNLKSSVSSPLFSPLTRYYRILNSIHVGKTSQVGARTRAFWLATCAVAGRGSSSNTLASPTAHTCACDLPVSSSITRSFLSVTNLYIGCDADLEIRIDYLRSSAFVFLELNE